MPVVLAVSGWKGSGKDTLAAHMVKKYGFARVSFADPLKDSVALEFGIPRESLDDPNLKESPLLDMPVDAQDGFSDMITNFMMKEFRTAAGTVATGLDDEYYWTPRALAILKGSTNRSVRSDFWVQKAIQSIKLSSRGLHVISDLRYKSEMKQLREAFGKSLITVRIERFNESPSKDPSERDLDDAQFDYIVDNTGNVEEFLTTVDSLAGDIRDAVRGTTVSDSHNR